MNFRSSQILNLILIVMCYSCKQEKKINMSEIQTKSDMLVEEIEYELLVEQPESILTPENMVWVKGKTFLQGAKKGDSYAMIREKPGHEVAVDGFFIDETEVTNLMFKRFVEATGYVTVAERPIDWQIMKYDLPPGTPKPADSVLRPGSLIFNKDVNAVVNMENYSQWWTWKIGASWIHPNGPDSSIYGKENYPVVHVTVEDAKAYCKWANRRLPTEAEWESAAQGKNNNTIFTWGNSPGKLVDNANTWQGVFPVKNESLDGFKLIAPVKSFVPNSMGIYDMLGNVWEITTDKFNVNFYKTIDVSKVIINPKGAQTYNKQQNPYQKEIVIKGGSFLCHASYCASFRISARMGMTLDSGSDHIGFRTVATVTMLSKENNSFRE